MENPNKLSRLLRVFLCHSTSDKSKIRNLYKKLQENGFDPWLDEEKLLPGSKWKEEITKAIRLTDIVVVCLSKNSISKTGYVQREIRFALEIALEQPEGTIYLIPLRLEDCNIPDSLSDWQWVNYFDENGYEKLLSSLNFRASALKKNELENKYPDISIKAIRKDPIYGHVASIRLPTEINNLGIKTLPLAIGIETLGGIFTIVISEGVSLPQQYKEIFSTASDNQSKVDINVLAGFRPLAAFNRSIGRFFLDGIPPAQRGVPKIEVCFDINTNGVLSVSAKDLDTNKEKTVTISNAILITPEEVRQLQVDKELHSESDHEFFEKTTLSNDISLLIFQIEHTLRDYSQRIDNNIAMDTKKAITDIQKTIQLNDLSEMKSKKQNLNKILNALAINIYTKK